MGRGGIKAFAAAVLAGIQGASAADFPQKSKYSQQQVADQRPQRAAHRESPSPAAPAAANKQLLFEQFLQWLKRR
jgi:hypothetical protein